MIKIQKIQKINEANSQRKHEKVSCILCYSHWPWPDARLLLWRIRRKTEVPKQI